MLPLTLTLSAHRPAGDSRFDGGWTRECGMGSFFLFLRFFSRLLALVSLASSSLPSQPPAILQPLCPYIVRPFYGAATRLLAGLQQTNLINL